MALPEHIVRNARQDLGKTKEAKILDAFTDKDDLEEEDELTIEAAEEAVKAVHALSRRAFAKSKATRIIDIALRDRMNNSLAK